MNTKSGSLSTTVKLLRAQEELTRRTADSLGVSVENLQDIPEDKINEAVIDIVTKNFDIESIIDWAHDLTNKAASEALQDMNFQAIMDGEPSIDREELENDPRVTLLLLVRQLPMVLFQGYLIGLTESQSERKKVSIADFINALKVISDHGSEDEQSLTKGVHQTLQKFMSGSTAEFISEKFFEDVIQEQGEQIYFLLGLAMGNILTEGINNVCD